jgi:hypothetical protein
MDSPDDVVPVGKDTEDWRIRLAADLKAYDASERETWGGTDENLHGRYVAGLCTDEERSRVEQAMRDYPAVRESIEVVRDIKAEWEAGLQPESPAVYFSTEQDPLSLTNPHAAVERPESVKQPLAASPDVSQPIPESPIYWRPLNAAFQAASRFGGMNAKAAEARSHPIRQEWGVIRARLAQMMARPRLRLRAELTMLCLGSIFLLACVGVVGLSAQKRETVGLQAERKIGAGLSSDELTFPPLERAIAGPLPPSHQSAIDDMATLFRETKSRSPQL